jgi:hypothetical protein
MNASSHQACFKPSCTSETLSRLQQKRLRTFTARTSRTSSARNLQVTGVREEEGRGMPLHRTQFTEPSLAPRCSFKCFRSLHSGRSVAGWGIAPPYQNCGTVHSAAAAAHRFVVRCSQSSCALKAHSGVLRCVLLALHLPRKPTERFHF